jgi:uncharacterized protein with PIN domain/sulfur carrier protein ThiS
MLRKIASFHFFNSLNDLLPIEKQRVDFSIDFQGDQSVKHLFESCGVPHTEVERVIVNGVSVSQKYIVRDGDQIEIYPTSLPPTQETDPGDQPGATRFVLDNHLGKLAAYLRLLGFDVIYRNDLQDEELARIASQEARILMTRDRRLLMRSVVTQGYCVRAILPRQQVVEVLTRYDLFSDIAPFGRCVHCNALLQPVSKDQILDRLQPFTRLYFDEFQRCVSCGQVYWKGSHYKHLQEFIQELRKRGG